MKLDRHNKTGGRNARLPLLSMLLWLIVPAIASSIPSSNAIAAQHTAIQGHRDAANFSTKSPGVAASDVLAQANTGSGCPSPALSRMTRHKVASGETLQSIANGYGLSPATLIAFNPSLRGGSVPVDREIVIPPVDGIRVQAPAGSTWKDLAAAYGVRADVLFELNGCQPQPQLVFIPAGNGVAGGRSPTDTYTGFAGYPLPALASVGLNYGWHQDATTGQATFHSGIDFLADVGTTVLSVDAGTVAFVGNQGNYGNLVVINHQGGRQTRYAHLSRIAVRVGQQVTRGDTLGTVGSTGQPDIDKSHLHFEVRSNSPQGWIAQDPQLHLPARPTAQR